ncbi:MAG: hypothetical protein COA81_06155 [Alphaproteobacteria bacterium]|nr:MAG: hypothetical protein COA81_06155 [Alphaproteobacteria bacterium]
MANGREKVNEIDIEHKAHLTAVGQGDGSLADIAGTALILAALDRPGVSFQKYEHHLKILALDLDAEGGNETPASARAEALAATLYDRHEYTGNEDYYDDLQNANLMSVIDTRRGLPISLSILYMHAARSQGWHVEGLTFPGHFLIRLSGAGPMDGRVILDPFSRGKIMDARGLRQLVSKTSSSDVDLKPDYYQPVTDREILIRLLDNIKIRCLKVSDMGQAITILSRQVLIDPDEIQHHYELGMLLAHVGKDDQAREYLTYCLTQSEKFERNDLIEQQVINTLKSLDKQTHEACGGIVLRLPEKE